MAKFHEEMKILEFFMKIVILLTQNFLVEESNLIIRSEEIILSGG